MMRLLPLLTFTLLQLVLIRRARSGPSLNENSKNVKSLVTSENLLKQHENIGLDSKSCRCVNEQCKLIMTKSTKFEMDCLENQNYCCDDDKMEPLVKIDKTDGDIPRKINATKEIQPLRARIRILVPSEDVIPNVEPMSNLSTNRVTELKPQIKCNCKLRKKCEDKYTDYTFGFHCSYDKVRCCEPQDQIKKEMNENSGGRLISIANGYNSKSINYECICISATDCAQIPMNVVATNEKDVLCPFKFVRCCGPSITKKSDTDIQTDDPQWNTSLEDEFEGRGIGINIHGQAAFRQPIQLPINKIPMNETRTTKGSDPIDSSVSAEIIQSPPELPTNYQNQYTGSPNNPVITNIFQQGVQRPPILQYFGGAGPYLQENPVPIPYRTVNVNSVPYGGRGRSESSYTSIFDTIANFFG